MNKNYIFKKVRRIECEDIKTGEILVTLNELKTFGISAGNESVDATGAEGRLLAKFENAKNAKITATDGLISPNFLALQLGSNLEELTDNQTLVKVTEILETTNGTSVTLPSKARGSVGAEIGFIYKSENGVAGESFMQDTTESATKFKYEASTRTITLPTGKFSAGDKVIVRYYPKFRKLERISNNAEKFSKTVLVRVHAFFTEVCSQEDVPVQLIMKKGKISGTLDLQAGDQVAVQNIEIEGMVDVCSDDKTLFDIVIYNTADIDNA